MAISILCGAPQLCAAVVGFSGQEPIVWGSCKGSSGFKHSLGLLSFDFGMLCSLLFLGFLGRRMPCFGPGGLLPWRVLEVLSWRARSLSRDLFSGTAMAEMGFNTSITDTAYLRKPLKLHVLPLSVSLFVSLSLSLSLCLCLSPGRVSCPIESGPTPQTSLSLEHSRSGANPKLSNVFETGGLGTQLAGPF